MEPSHPEYVEVAFPLPVDQTFTYSVPAGQRTPVERGMRVLAPLGVQTLEGVVVGVSVSPAIDAARIKPIIDALDRQPSFSQELLELCRWVGEYYLAPWGEALGAATPASVRVLSRRRVTLTAAATDAAIRGLRARAPVQAAVLESLSAIDGQTVGHLRAAIEPSSVYGPLAALESVGLVRIASETRSAGRPKRVRGARLAEPPSTIARHLADMAKTAPKQVAVLEYLCRVNDAMPLTTITREADASHATIRTLVDKGLLAPEEIEETRTPQSEVVGKVLDVSADPLTLNSDQSRALEAIRGSLDRSRHETFVLHGVTGSGKTEVYMQAIQRALDQSRSALMLVPEIALTPQTVGRFVARFGPRVGVLHSHLSAGERYDEWRCILTGNADVVVGARSAIFAPLSRLGIVIVDEEHETTYKQDDPAPRYHAREVALERARIAGAPLVLGSATPSLETIHAGRTGKFHLLRLPDRVRHRSMPQVHLRDMREEITANNFTIFSRRLRNGITDRLSRSEQVLLFLNRRGSSTYVFCRDCGHVEVCTRCNISMTHHRKQDVLICHYCGYVKVPPTHCAACHGSRVKFLGLGTQQVEEHVRRVFPSAVVRRMDTDTTARKGTHQNVLQSFRDGEIDVLVGTQMIAKGLDFPNVTLVGIVLGETALHMPDFRAAERTFNLLTQVAGRSGRSDLGGEVVLQTYQPGHFSIVAAQNHDYEAFVEQELTEREAHSYPPFTHLVRLLFRGEGRDATARAARHVKANCDEILTAGDGVSVKGPASAPLSRVRGEYRWHLLLCGQETDLLRSVATDALADPGTEISGGHVAVVVDVDPTSLL